MTGLITSLLDMIINFCNANLPTYNFDNAYYSSMSSSVTMIVKFLADVNFIVPLVDIAKIMMLSIGLHLFKFGLFCGNWIVRRICDIVP